ncbi:MAG: hypothetical protein KAX54_00215 [Thauera sp.]|nr:hypothetical protein [Thauera sp.]
MSWWEANGATDEWWTPPEVFDALGVEFDLDVAAPVYGTHVPASCFLTEDGLEAEWFGFVWMNAPFGGRNGLKPWLDRFVEHGNGIALTPDRTSAPWWQPTARKVDLVFFVARKVQFLRPDGSRGKSPSTGTTLFGMGPKAHYAFANAARAGFGVTLRP